MKYYLIITRAMVDVAAGTFKGLAAHHEVEARFALAI
jgi:hypothetical protein